MRFYTNVKQVGNYIYVRGYENGVSFKDRVEYKPTLYIKSKEASKYKTLQGEYLNPIKPGTIRDTRAFLEKYKDIDNFSIYGDISPVTQYISENYLEENIEFDINKIKIYVVDIETTSAYGFPNVEQVREEVLLITVQDFATKQSYTWGSRQFSEKIENNIYYECADEVDLLQKFLAFWESEPPDVITGWNVEFFDIPYLVRRISSVISESQAKRLSVWKYIRERKVKVEKTNREEYVYELAGTSCLDFLSLFKKFSQRRLENNRLETVAQEILNETKLDHSQYETFADFYTQDFATFTKYNIKDCELVSKLEESEGLIGLALTMAFDARVNFEDVFFQVRMWDSIIYNYLRKIDIAIPPKEFIGKDSKYTGAYVKEPVPGMYGWILSLDLTSLYPSLIMQYNISPETILDEKYPGITVEKILNKEVNIKNIDGKCVCANGCLYDTTKKGIFPKLVEKIFDNRQYFKKQMLMEKSKLQDIECELSRRGFDPNSL